MSDWKSERGRVASLSRSRADNDPDLLDARRNLKVARLAEHIQRSVSAAPALTPTQLERLAALLRPAGGGHDAA